MMNQTFRNLGVFVRDGQVFKSGLAQRLLGDLSGAHVEAQYVYTDRMHKGRVGDAVAGAVVLGPVGLLLGAVSPKTTKATMVITFANGRRFEHAVQDYGTVKGRPGPAQVDADRFNALAALPPVKPPVVKSPVVVKPHVTFTPEEEWLMELEPLPNYDELSVASLRARLRNLDIAQVRQLADYERAHAARADVLDMLERRIAKLALAHVLVLDSPITSPLGSSVAWG
jgi:hypothetical protein